MENFQKIAVLIDADNTQLSKLEAVLHEVSTYGRIVVKKAYGNWRKDSLKNWEPELKRLAIRAEQRRIVRQARLRLGDAHRQTAKAKRLQLAELFARGGQDLRARAAVDPAHDGVDLFLDRCVEVVGKAEAVFRPAQAHDLARERLAAAAAVGPDGGQHDADTQLPAQLRQQCDLAVGVGGEAVDGHDARQAERVADAAHMV